MDWAGQMQDQKSADGAGPLGGIDVDAIRRSLLLGPLVGLLSVALTGVARAGTIDPSMTQVIFADAIKWKPWSGAPPHMGEMATLYGGLDEPGPYVVLMKWYPGFMSAPHSYRTDRLSVVLSGTWWVDSGSDFEPERSIPVAAGGFVRRGARTPHYDGVKEGATEPAVIGIFGIAPVALKMVDPSKPGWRQV